MPSYISNDFTLTDCFTKYGESLSIDLTPTYLYTGLCPQSGDLLQLPRTLGVESIARTLMSQLVQDDRYQREGKMYGVLLVETQRGEWGILKAFSGSLNGVDKIAGWVPPIPGRERVKVEETQTLQDLETMKQELISLARLPQREEYGGLVTEFASKLEQQSIEHRERKQFRQQQRAKLQATLADAELTIALEQLEQNSRQDGRERRQLKNERDRILQPLSELIAIADDRISALKQQRKNRSRQLQTQMHDAYRLMNFLGTNSSLRELMPAGIPTGTGDCCAPKLLHYAASHQLTPIALAEFWWGENSLDKTQGEFYGACEDRCQPLMGFMLSGLRSPAKFSLPIIYEDEYLIAIDKPAGLLSVPGRYLKTQDSLTTRLRQFLADDEIYPVHRLDRDTSGILLFARAKSTYRHLSQQFEQRQVHKVYEAILGGEIDRTQGSIDLLLSSNPNDRPRQIVDPQHGKPSLTKFQVLAKIGTYTRIELIPLTGRTHQLRVHTAAPQGLGVPILGDRLYGCLKDGEWEWGSGRVGEGERGGVGDRLYLHARELTFAHPTLGVIHLHTESPF